MPSINVTTTTATTITTSDTLTAANGIRMPTYTNGTRPASADTGALIFNTTDSKSQVWTGGEWAELGEQTKLDTWAGEGARPASPSGVGIIGWNSTDNRLELFSGVDQGVNQWATAAAPAGGGPAGTQGTFEALRSSLAPFGYNDVSQVSTALSGVGYTLIATPCYGGMAESQNAQNPISSRGQFYRDEFDSNTTLINSTGFTNATFNGIPWMGFAGYAGSTFRGLGCMFYRDYSSAALRDFFYPEQERNLYAYILNADGSTREEDGTNTSTYYSDGQDPGSNGYYQSNRFARDDGSWGVRLGTQRLDGNGGPYLNDDHPNSYGTENRNSGDSCCPEMFWGPNTQTGITDFTFFFFVEKS